MNAAIGVFCLGALWIAALLVAGAALQDLRDLRARRKRMRVLADGETGVGLWACEIVEGRGTDGALATHEVTQVGRALDADPPAIAFRDTGYVSHVHGGAVRIASATVVIPADVERVSVSTSRRARDTAARTGSQAFDDAHALAATARGFARIVTTAVRAGDRIFVAGELARRGDDLVLEAPAGAELMISVEEPRALTLRQSAVTLLFVVGELLVCLGCTIVALWPPVFGRVSTVGAALCLAFFLGVTPLAVAIRERCLPPSRAPLHGGWERG